MQTNRMGEKYCLSVAEVCKIINISSKVGVSEISYGDLSVKFGRSTEPGPDGSHTGHRLASLPVKNITDEQHETQSKASLEAEEVLLREEQLARALVEDPVRFEELLRNGDLGDELDSSNDSDGIDDSE